VFNADFRKGAAESGLPDAQDAKVTQRTQKKKNENQKYNVKLNRYSVSEKLIEIGFQFFVFFGIPFAPFA
jgi:hypothetical protein